MIYFIIGGARSGKSTHAMKMALERSSHPTYVATARRWDKNFEDRIVRHIADRSDQWVTVEVEKEIGKIDLRGKVAVIDCVTLWLTNFFVDSRQHIDDSFSQAREQFDQLSKQEGVFFVVSNEIGMGVHAPTEDGRKFADLQGRMNQYIAGKSDTVVLMVAGIAVTVKEHPS